MPAPPSPFPAPPSLPARVGKSLTGIYEYGIEPGLQMLLNELMPNLSPDSGEYLGHLGSSAAEEMALRKLMLEEDRGSGQALFSGRRLTPLQERLKWAVENPPDRSSLDPAQRHPFGGNPFPHPYPFRPPPLTPAERLMKQVENLGGG